MLVFSASTGAAVSVRRGWARGTVRVDGGAGAAAAAGGQVRRGRGGDGAGPEDEPRAADGRLSAASDSQGGGVCVAGCGRLGIVVSMSRTAAVGRRGKFRCGCTVERK